MVVAEQKRMNLTRAQLDDIALRARLVPAVRKVMSHPLVKSTILTLDIRGHREPKTYYGITIEARGDEIGQIQRHQTVSMIDHYGETIPDDELKRITRDFHTHFKNMAVQIRGELDSEWD